MKLVRYLSPTGVLEVGELTSGATVQPLAAAAATGQEELLALATGAAVDLRPPADASPLPWSAVRALTPIARPPSVRDFLTFERHFEVMMRDAEGRLPEAWYDFPVFYFTSPHDLVGDGAQVHPPPGSHLDFELEVAVVIGRDGRNLTPESALDHLAGYALFNDYSARDIQAHEMPIGLGPSKCKDFGGALGPVLVTPEELAGTPGRPTGVLRATVNGQPYSEGELGEMRYSFAEMVAHASTSSWVRAGDVLGSGTCSTGCIAELAKTHGPDRYPWLQEGDVVEISHDVLGALTTTVGAPG